MSVEIKECVIIHGNFKPVFFDELSKQKRDIVVLEGRPDLKAGRASCRRLQKIGITPTVMADNMAGYLFAKGLVSQVCLSGLPAQDKGAECVIGALILAVLAKHHKVPVSVYPHAGILKKSGKPGDLGKFNGQTVIKGRIKAFVPLREIVPGKYFKTVIGRIPLPAKRGRE